MTFRNKENKETNEYLPITDRLYEILIKLKEISKQRQGTDQQEKVFRWSVNSGTTVSGAFSYIERRAGTKIKNNSLHKIRKTYATLIAEDNSTNQYDLKDLVRHSDVKTTLKYYRKQKLNKQRIILDSVLPGKKQQE